MFGAMIILQAGTPDATLEVPCQIVNPRFPHLFKLWDFIIEDSLALIKSNSITGDLYDLAFAMWAAKKTKEINFRTHIVKASKIG